MKVDADYLDKTRGRSLYAEIGRTQRIITLYWTNQFKRYWKENSHEI